MKSSEKCPGLEVKRLKLCYNSCVSLNISQFLPIVKIRQVTLETHYQS